VLKSIKRTEIGRLLDSYKAQEEDDTTSTQWQEKEALGFLDKSFESAQKQLAGDDVYNSNPIADPSSPMEVNTNGKFMRHKSLSYFCCDLCSRSEQRVDSRGNRQAHRGRT